MIRPTVYELLTGVADELQTTVLPELAQGAPRSQLVAAIAIIRRVARSSELAGAYIDADNRDIAGSLRTLLPRIEDTALHARTAALLSTVPADNDPYPLLDDLAATNASLQALVAEVHNVLGAAADDVLLALYNRMLEREAEMVTAPRAR